MRRGTIVTTLSLVGALLLAWSAFAEDRVVSDRDGGYRQTRIVMMETGVSDVSTRSSESTDNAESGPDGRVGEDVVSVGEEEDLPFHPWGVWSRRNDVDFDLAWSRWTTDGWQPLRWLDPETPQVGDDNDAKLAIDHNGRPYVVWWRDEDGHGRIYLSVFLVSTWMRPYPVSPLSIDGRYPNVSIVDRGVIEVGYETPDGKVVQFVRFSGPVTITDDIDPLDYVSSGEVLYRAQAAD